RIGSGGCAMTDSDRSTPLAPVAENTARRAAAILTRSVSEGERGNNAGTPRLRVKFVCIGSSSLPRWVTVVLSCANIGCALSREINWDSQGPRAGARPLPASAPAFPSEGTQTALNPSTYPVDLSTALRLAEVENPVIAEARAQLKQAE